MQIISARLEYVGVSKAVREQPYLPFADDVDVDVSRKRMRYWHIGTGRLGKYTSDDWSTNAVPSPAGERCATNLTVK